MTGQVKWHQRLHSESGSEEPDNCTWDNAARLIYRLNGCDRSDVFLGYLGEEGVDRQLSVTGGNVGRYVVVVQEPSRYFHLCRRPVSIAASEPVEVVVGGLPAFFPLALIHSKAAALEAAEHYFRTGRRARHLSWMRGEVAQRLRFTPPRTFLRV